MIKPDYVTLEQLLQGKLFRIPDYQRAYSWQQKQRDALFNDIKNLRNRNASEDKDHFLATVVLMQTVDKKEAGPDEFRVFDIVDGQQRLTTLVILLKAISKALLGGEAAQHRYGQDLQDVLVKRENDQLILLQTNHESAADFRRYLVDGTFNQDKDASTTAQKCLMDAFEACESFVRDWPNGPTDLLKLVKNRLTFVNYVLADQGAAYTIFEVLNSRGLPVDALDKCKSMMMSMLYDAFDTRANSEHQHEIHKLWTMLYREVGVDEVSSSDVLRFSAALLSSRIQSKVLSDDDALAEIRQRYEKEPIKLLDAVAFFVGVAKTLKVLNSKRHLKAVSRIRQSRLLYAAISQARHLSGVEKTRALDSWEKATFLIYGIFRRDTRYEVGEMVKLSWRIINESMSIDNVITALNSIAMKYMDSKKTISDQLMLTDSYNQWDEEARYFFFKYEEQLALADGHQLPPEVWKEIWATTPAKSIEHILPQNTEAKDWVGKFGGKAEARDACHRLGNLLLLPPRLNAQAGDLGYKAKRALYEQCTYLRAVGQVLKLPDWDEAALDHRDLELANWAESYWSFKP